MLDKVIVAINYFTRRQLERSFNSFSHVPTHWQLAAARTGPHVTPSGIGQLTDCQRVFTTIFAA